MTNVAKHINDMKRKHEDAVHLQVNINSNYEHHFENTTIDTHHQHGVDSVLVRWFALKILSSFVQVGALVLDPPMFTKIRLYSVISACYCLHRQGALKYQLGRKSCP